MKLALIEQGKAPTVVSMAKELGIHRVTLYQFLARYPWLDEWVESQALAANVHLWGLVERRHAFLGIQGSTASAEVYAKMQRGVYARAGAPGDPNAGSLGDGRITVTNNFLVPRPDYVGAAALPVATPVPALPPPAPAARKIPVVSVR